MPAPVSYATRANIFALGLRAEVFASRARAIESVDPDTGVMRLSSHGYDGGLPLLNFVVTGSASLGRPTVLLPVGLSQTVVYQPTAFLGSGNLFQVAPVNGAVISSFGNAGTGTFSVEADIGSTLDAILQNESANINNDLTAHDPPIVVYPETGLYPEILIGVTARRAALRARLVLGLSNPQHAASFAPIEAAEADDTRRLAEWMKGRPILPRPVDQTGTRPDDAPRYQNITTTGGGRASAWNPGVL